jgi:ElaB/YqjD/DUF883 family membrane-anchored ribosome-binding protein
METPANFAPIGREGNGGAGGIEQAAPGVNNTIDSVSGATRPAIDRIATGAHRAVDSFADVANQAAESLGVKSGELKEMQTRLMEACGGYVRANPLASLGIAVAAGFLLSRLISSR